jgi:hypothetical protein
MSKKKRSPKKKSKRSIPRRLDLNSVEDDTLKRVSRTLKTIESFLSRWDSSNAKADDLLPQIMKIRKFHDALATWQNDAMKSKGSDDEETRMRRLRDFVLICQTYQ